MLIYTYRLCWMESEKGCLQKDVSKRYIHGEWCHSLLLFLEIILPVLNLVVSWEMPKEETHQGSWLGVPLSCWLRRIYKYILPGTGLRYSLKQESIGYTYTSTAPVMYLHNNMDDVKLLETLDNLN